jgi:membrane-associated phospholipid phosphatase
LGAVDTAARPRRATAALVLLGLVALHLALYGTVNAVNAARPAGDFVRFAIPLDDRIPFLPASWVVYYLGDVYIVAFGAWMMLQLVPSAFRRAAAAYAATIVLGAAVQIVLPSRAPWPAELTPVQSWVHGAIALRPFASLPSMHVALSVLPAAIGLSVLRRPTARAGAVLAAALISLSTLTLKEHVVLDVVTGALLALGAWAYWKSGVPGAAVGLRRERGTI